MSRFKVGDRARYRDGIVEITRSPRGPGRNYEVIGEHGRIFFVREKHLVPYMELSPETEEAFGEILDEI